MRFVVADSLSCFGQKTNPVERFSQVTSRQGRNRLNVTICDLARDRGIERGSNTNIHMLRFEYWCRFLCSPLAVSNQASKQKFGTWLNLTADGFWRTSYHGPKGVQVSRLAVGSAADVKGKARKQTGLGVGTPN